jgi:hypothetical protein
MHTKKVFSLYVISLFIVSLLFVVGCGDSPTSNQPLTKSSSVVLKTGIKSNQSVSSIPVTGGTLDLASANFNLEKLAIQENSGFDGEQQGENGNGNEGGSEGESPDVIVNGPLNFDIAAGDVTLYNINAYPGTYKKVDIYFKESSIDPFNGNSIFVSGTFIKSDGTQIQFELRSNYSSMYETMVANGGITLLTNQTVEVKITFDLVALFGNLDFNNAVLTGNTILIDSSNNTAILAAFESNLQNSIEMEENH